MKLKEIVFED